MASSLEGIFNFVAEPPLEVAQRTVAKRRFHRIIEHFETDITNMSYPKNPGITCCGPFFEPWRSPWTTTVKALRGPTLIIFWLRGSSSGQLLSAFKGFYQKDAAAQPGNVSSTINSAE
ncbi:hypothetical protein F4818DRAFT_440495 [Hypoxylon cercidicola]|nr:hypothetical protein F4818DRAFT_440495 [Hypoxylon cercidicola]